MYEKIKNITLHILSKLGFQDGEQPDMGIVLGSGLGALCELIEDPIYLPYDSIEGFVVSTVAGHQGRFVGGTLAGKRIVVMQGRMHFYEGYTMDEVTLGVRVMCMMGIRTLVVTNAAGGVNPKFVVGDVMLIEDQINLLPNPLIGRNLDQIGPRFVDMTEPFSSVLRASAIIAADRVGVSMVRGTYLGSSGPTYETPAEYRFFRAVGADACGMSTTPEVIVARHAGVEVLGFSIITNVGINEGVVQVKNSHDDVVNAAKNATGKLIKIIEQWLKDY